MTAQRSAGAIPTEAANPYQNRDPRFYADILSNGASFQGRPAQFWLGGLDSKLSSLSPWNASKTGYTILKMVDSTYNFNVQPYSPAQWVVFRLSEIYLNYAEAEAELGQTGNALTYLNKIRERAGMPDVTSRRRGRPDREDPAGASYRAVFRRAPVF
jgi:hypothetical protein